jgi:hypothetical protein
MLQLAAVHVTPPEQVWSPTQPMLQVPAPEQVIGPWQEVPA